MIEPAAALKHWSAWAVDTGNWRRTCAGIEKRWVNDPSRYVHPDDVEKRFRFKYDQRIGETVEALVCAMHDQEKLVLRAKHIYCSHMEDEKIASSLGMSPQAFDTVLCAATVRFGRIWREMHRSAA